MARVLVVDDEKLIVKGIRFSLEQDGYEVDCAYDGEEAIEMARKTEYDIVLLDVMLPKHDGFEVCQTIREFSDMPVIMLTAKGSDMDKILGLEYGADDYVTKPFKLGELFSRIRALQRRASMSTKDTMTVLECGDISIDLLGSSVFLKGKIIELTNAEYRLLCLLVKNVNRVVSREYILHELWDDTGNYVDDNTLSVYIRRLREKIEIDASHPQHLITVRGFGYKWKEVEI